FSSRRRHTRSSRDWSSDVCSSDLAPPTEVAAPPSENAIAAAPMESGAAQQLRTTNRVEPVYPSTSRRMGEEGTVRLRVLVDEKGRQSEVDELNRSGSTRVAIASIDDVERSE